jgi:Ca2+/Na+ antiporter
MIKENELKGTYSFSHFAGYVFVIKHLEKFLILTILIIVLAAYKGNLDIIVTICAILLLCLLYYCVEKLLKKSAYKINIDFKSRQLRFHMNRSEDIISITFDDIKNIIVNFHITFLLEEKKILYNDLQNKELLNCLNKIRKLHWGPLSVLFVTDKDLRESLKK